MVAPLLIMAGIQAAQGVMAQRAQNYASIQQNEAIGKANIENVIRTGYRTGILSLQAAQAKKQNAQNGFSITAQHKAVLGSAVANTAAAGTVGASADAVKFDIDRAANVAQSNLDLDWEIQSENFKQQLHDTIQAGKDSLRTGVSVPSAGMQFLGLAASTGASVAGQYASAKMNLGLGTKAATPSTYSPSYMD